MSEVSDLKEQYNAVINQETDWGFFVSLAGYVDYILEMPALKKITDEVMLMKQKEYDKLAGLEDKAIKELEIARVKLLKIIKNNNISPDSLGFGHNAVPQSVFKNILDELEAFEEGTRYSISGFKSDNLMNFLLDIASSLFKLGHKSLVKDFLVSNEEYERYYYEPDSRFRIKGDEENGNFIFSNTLKLRREQTKLIKNAERYELWGAFNAIFKLQRAFLEKSKHVCYDDIIKKYSSDKRNCQEAGDAVDIVFYAEGLTAISGDKSSFANQNTQYLFKKIDFKNHLSRVNTYLLKELAKFQNKKDRKEAGGDKSEKPKTEIVIDFQKGIYNVSNPKSIYEIRGKRFKTLECLIKNKSASLADLIANTGQTDALIVKEINGINSNVRKLKVKFDLIIHSKTGGGYRLNNEELNIDIKNKTST